MPHDPTHEYDDACEGCQPGLMDPKTQKILPLDHPDVIAIRRAFKEDVTLIERRAWHRVVQQGSKGESDMRIAQKVAMTLQAAMQREQ